LFLPCSYTPSLPWCAQVLADIGDEQSLQQNLSTFSGHVKRIIRIFEALKRGPQPALVLLDEIGAGTDPTEGQALAVALLKSLANRARLTIATTHFGELKILKYQDSRFENASVAFNSDTMSPTYELQWGIPGSSNAVAIAAKLGLDDEIIQATQDAITSKGGVNISTLISGLEEQRRNQQISSEAAAVLLARTELLHEELLEHWEQQCRNTSLFEEIARQKLDASIREGQQEVKGLIRKLRDTTVDG